MSWAIRRFPAKVLHCFLSCVCLVDLPQREETGWGVVPPAAGWRRGRCPSDLAAHAVPPPTSPQRGEAMAMRDILFRKSPNISSKVLAFAFSLSAESERSMISSRTKEALARKKSEGKRLGRPKGKFSSVTKLSGKDDLIREYLDKKIPQSVIARLLNVHRLTVRNYILTRKLQKSAP